MEGLAPGAKKELGALSGEKVQTGSWIYLGAFHGSTCADSALAG